MEPVVFDNETLRRHPIYASCRNTLNAVSNRDYPDSDFFRPDIECLDLDWYEKEHCDGQADCTVDAVLGICDCRNKRRSAYRLLLVELRLNYKSERNLSKTDMERKVLHTKEILGNELPVERESVFIFDDRIAGRARNWFYRQAQGGGELRFCVPYAVSDFPSIVMSYEDMPYVPVNDIEKALKEMKEKDWAGFLKGMGYWIKKAGEYSYSNPFEERCIQDMLKEAYLWVKETKGSWNDDELLDMDILKEDAPYL